MSGKRKPVIVFLVIAALTLSGLLVAVLGFFTPADRQALLSGQRTFAFNGSTRRYRLVVPKGLSDKPSLIIVLHGLGGTGRQIAYFAALHNSTGTDAILVYPDAGKARAGQRPGWNADFCCGSGWGNKIDDAGFILALIEAFKASYGVNAGKVYLVGFSNGAMLAHKLASAYPEVFAGFAAVAGTIGTNKQQLDPKGPVPALLMHGERDRIIPIGGGTGKNFPDFVWKSFADTVASWKQANNCEEHVERRDEKNRTAIYAQCSAPLATVIFEKDGHEWHDWRLLNFWHQRPEGSRRVADFFNSLQAGRQAANPSANE